MRLNQKHRGERCQEGNKKAHLGIAYLNHRLRTTYFRPSSKEEDLFYKLDYFAGKIGYQFKARLEGNDVISELQLFYDDGPDKGYTVVPGRDACTLADYYIVSPAKRDRLIFPKNESVKEQIYAALDEWGMPTTTVSASNGVVCKQVAFSRREIATHWREALWTASWSKLLFISSKGVHIRFKIDEGEEEKVHGKILFFIPPHLLKGTTMRLREGESFEDPTTWK